MGYIELAEKVDLVTLAKELSMYSKYLKACVEDEDFKDLDECDQKGLKKAVESADFLRNYLLETDDEWLD